ncbi:MAG TPA: hypothetical protein PKY59_04735 [Pyrinomonadaceae bacterium]|nr:hypothetical protein [Pyrinomonadaceae bacterium]
MLTKCVNCQFYVRNDDEYCLNCGFLKPAITKDDVVFNVNRAGIWFLLLTILSYPFFVLISSGKNIVFLSISALVLAVLFGLLSSMIFEIIFEFRTSETNYDRRKNGSQDNLQNKNKIIQNRISDLLFRLKGIDAVLEKITDNDGQNLLSVRQTLLSAREIVSSQIARYEIQNQKIELVRLQNSVLPFIFSLDDLNDFQIENGLVTAGNNKTEVGKLKQKLAIIDEDNLPVQTLNEKRHFLSQLQETENSCAKLREALLSKQAAQALKGIAPIEENLKLPSLSDAVHSAETFNLQATLTDFSESFEELEREYKRVRAESKASEKLLEN